VNAPRYVPDFALEVNGAPAPAALRGSVASVSATAAFGGAARVELSIANEGLRWLDHKLLALDTPLSLSLGYRPGALHKVFTGRVLSQQASFPASGMPMLTVAAQDRIQRLSRGTKSRWFPLPIPKVGNFPLADPQVAQLVGLEHGFVPLVDPVEATLSILLGGAAAVVAAAQGEADAMQRMIRRQTRETDFDFLARVARENGWEMFVEHSGPLAGRALRFMSPLSHLEPDAALRYGRSLIDFSPRVTDVGRIVSVTAHVWLPALKTELAVTVGWDWDRMALAIDIAPSAQPAANGETRLALERPASLLSAPRDIVSVLLPKLNQRLTASASTIGDPRLALGGVVKIEGVGQQFGGLYRITSVTHTIDGGGYRTSLELRKEIWFGAIPLSAQGAVPVRLDGPWAA